MMPTEGQSRARLPANAQHEAAVLSILSAQWNVLELQLQVGLGAHLSSAHLCVFKQAPSFTSLHLDLLTWRRRGLDFIVGSS